MKKRFGLVALLLTAVFMLSSCELIQAFKAFKGIADDISDYNSVYVANGTDASITVKFEEDPEGLEEGATQQKGSFTLKKGAVKEKAFSAGYFKLTIGDEQVMPGANENTYEYHSKGYYVLSANTKVTITKDSEGKYIYTSESRTSSSE